jgi:hypothetical protein
MVNIFSFKKFNYILYKNILTSNLERKCQNKNLEESQEIATELIIDQESLKLTDSERLQRIPRGLALEAETLESGACERLQAKHYDIFNDKEQFIRYTTSFRKYTIISVDNNGKDLFDTMINEKYDTYYMDLNNIIEKDTTLSYLIKNYKSYNSGEKLWVFCGDFFIGSREDMLDIIKKHKKHKEK